MQKNIITVATISLLCLVTVAVLPWMLEPRIPPTGFYVNEDTEFVVTRAQLVEGVTLVVPNLDTKPESTPVTVLSLPPFEVTPLGQRQLSSGDVFKVTLIIAPDTALTSGEYQGALAVVGENSRKITIKVTDNPLVPVVVVFLGLVFSYGITRWWNHIRPEKILEGEAFELLAEICTHSEDVSPGEEWFTIVNAASSMVGIEKNPSSMSLRGLLATGRTEKARERLESLRTFFRKFKDFLKDVQNLHSVYTDVKETVKYSRLSGSRPGVEKEAKEFFSGRKIMDTDHLSDLSRELEDLSELYDLLDQIYGRYENGKIVIRDLETTIQNMSTEDLNSFNNARETLREAMDNMWEARSTDEAKILKVQEQTWEALGTLRGLWSEYFLERAAAEMHTRAYAGLMVDHTQKSGIVFRSAKSSDTAPPSGEVDQPAPETLRDKAQTLQNLVAIADIFSLAVGWFIAAATAMVILYVNKPFGALDYLFAFLWGSGVDQTLKGVNSVLSKLGMKSFT